MNNNKSIELQEAISTYIEWKAQTISSAYRIYLPVLKMLNAHLEYRKHVNQLLGDDIISFQRWMNEKGYSSAYKALAMRIIRNFVFFWHGRGQINMSPKEIIPPRVVTPEQPVVDVAEFKLMSELLDDNLIFDLQKKLAIHLLWETGVRVSELVDIKLENIQISENGLRTAVIKTKKTDRYNLIAWGSETNRLLEKYIGMRLCFVNDSDYLFTSLPKNRISKRLTRRTVERWVHQLSEDAMIGKKITPHSFRHGKAHYILDNGGDAIDVQALLRHKNLESSLQYMRLNRTRYLARARKYVHCNNMVKIPISGEDSKTETIIPQVVQSTRIVYNVG